MGGRPRGGDRRRLAGEARPGDLHRAAGRATADRHPAQQSCLRADQPRRTGPAAGGAGLRPIVDSRRRPHLGGSPSARPRRRGAGLRRVVRRLPVPLGEGALLRRPPGRRPGAGARQRRRAALRGRRGFPLHRRPRLRPPALAARRGGGQVPRVPTRRADHRRVPGAGQAPLLRPAPRVDQPRGLLGPAGPLLLGRFLGAARSQGRRGAGRRDGRGRRSRALGRPPRRLRRRPLRLAGQRHGDARHRLPARVGREGRLRSHLHHHRPGAGRRAGPPAGAPAPGDLRALLEPVPAPARPPPGAGGRRLHPLRAALGGRLRPPRLARAGGRAARLLPRRSPAGRVGTSGRRWSGATRGRPASSATCRTPGSAPTPSARSSTSSPTSGSPTAPWWWRPGSPRSGSPAASRWGWPACGPVGDG